jgi:hypothetical protein
MDGVVIGGHDTLQSVCYWWCSRAAETWSTMLMAQTGMLEHDKRMCCGYTHRFYAPQMSLSHTDTPQRFSETPVVPHP